MKRLSEIRKTITELTAFQDPPTVLIMRRKGIRLFPNGQRVATYKNDNLDLEVAIPYNPQTLGQHKIATVGTSIGESFENVSDVFKADTIKAAYHRLASESPKSDLDNALFNWLDSEMQENGSKVEEWDDEVLDDVFDDYQALIGVREETAHPSDTLFGAYLHSAQLPGRPGRVHSHLETHIGQRYGEKAAQHLKASVSHYIKGETELANHHYAKYKHEASLVGEALDCPDKLKTWKQIRKVHAIGPKNHPVSKQMNSLLTGEEVQTESAQGKPDGQYGKFVDQRAAHNKGHEFKKNCPDCVEAKRKGVDPKTYRFNEEVIVEATIHSLHTIAKSKTPATVRFKNGSNAMVHHGTAARIMRLHSLMRKHNKRKVEALVNSSPDGLKKVVDFVDTHLK